MFMILFIGFILFFSAIGGAINGLSSLKDMAFTPSREVDNSNSGLTWLAIVILILWAIF
jgi:hypothetical protein